MVYTNLLGQSRVGVRNRDVISANLVTSGLILHLDSGNSSSYSGTGTTWTDLSGNGRNTTLYNGSSYSSLDGGKIVFDGIDDYAEVSNPPMFGSGDFSVEVWFKRKESTLYWDGSYLISKWSSGANAYWNEWSLGFGDSQSSSYGNNLNFSLEAQGGGFYGITSDEILINTWYQAVIVREGGTLKMYINGTLRTTSTPSISYYGALGTKSINPAGRKLRINRQDNTDSLQGNIEVPIVRIYNKALTLLEVGQNYLNNKGRFGMLDNPQILNNLILDINPSLYVANSPTLINPANVGNNIKVWGNETDPTSAPIWNKKWFTFDGINDYLEIKDAKPFMFGTQSFSISTWTKMKTANFGWNGGLVNKWFTGASPGANNWATGMADYNVLKPSFSIDSNGTFYSVSSPDNLSINVWYHVVAVRDSVSLKIYVDGVLKGTNSPTGFSSRSITNYIQPLYIGKVGVGSNSLMDSGRSQIYNKALTFDEISSLYNTQSLDFIKSSGLVFHVDPYYPSSYSGTGTRIYDISGSGYYGDFTNGAVYATASNGVVRFDGVDDYINTNVQYSVPAGGNFTIGVWFKGVGHLNTTNDVLVMNYSGTPVGWAIYQGMNGKFLAFSRDNNSNDSTYLYSTTTTNTNQWFYGVYKKSGNTFSLYVNGVLETTSTSNLGAITITNNMRIGNHPSVSQPYNGSIGNVQVYNRSLTDSEILHNFNSSKSRFGL